MAEVGKGNTTQRVFITDKYIYKFNTLIYCPNMVKKNSTYVGPRDEYPTMYVNYTCKLFLKKNLQGLLTLFSLQTVFCYQYVEL